MAALNTARVDGTVLSVEKPWLFFVVTYVISWSFLFVAIALDISFDSGLGVMLFILALTGPGIAGIAFTYLVYDERGRRDFWRRVIDVRRIGLRWFLVILLLVPALNVVAALIDILLGGTGATWSDGVRGFALSPLSLLPAVFFATLPPFLEELGWRGYVLDRLQLRWSALGASLILGVVWSLWHLPTFFIDGTYQHGLGVGTLEFWGFMVGIVPLTVAYTWVYNHTNRSILAIILLHGMTNFTGEFIHVTPRADAIAIMLWIAFAIVITAVWGPKTLSRSPDVPKPPMSGAKSI
jgi:membrane protease YdiL (CAAX protease family)